MIKAVIGLAACGVLAAGLTGCTRRAPQGAVTVTVTPSHSRSSSATVSSPATPTTSTATTMTRLPGTCDTLLPTADVSTAIGGNGLAGKDEFVVGPPQKDIGRLAYLNCRYGVTGAGAAATPKIEVGVSLYSTRAAAAARVTATTDDYTAHGATATAVRVGSVSGTLLSGGTGSGYDAPVLVVSSGQRTVAVTVAAAAATGAAARNDATAVAKLALSRTGG